LQTTTFDLDSVDIRTSVAKRTLRVDAWRHQITSALLQVLLITGLLALFASPVWSFERENHFGLLTATGLFVAVSGILFLSRNRLHFSAGLIMVLAYLSIASLLMSVVPHTLPFHVVFALTILAAYLLNDRITPLISAGVVALLLATNLAFWFLALRPDERPEVDLSWWVVCFLSFLVVALVVALPQRQLIDQVLKVLTQLDADKRAIQNSEQQFLTIFNTVSDAIFIHDLDTGQILNVNDAMCRAWHCTREFALSVRSINELSYGQSPYSDVEARAWMRRAAMGEPCNFEWYCRDTRGRLFWMEMSICRARLGDRDRLVVTGRDIHDRVMAQKSLQHQMAVQRLAIVFSARMLAASERSFEEAINNLLREIGRLFGVHAVSLARIDADDTHYKLSHLWMAEGFSAFFDRFESVPLSAVPWAAEVLRTGQARRMNDISDLPAKHSIELQVLQRKGVKATLAVPLRGSGSEMIGSLCVCMLTGPRKWTDEEEGQLQLLAGLLAAALDGHAAQTALRASEEHARQTAESNGRLLAEVNHRVRNNLASILSLVSLSAAKETDVQAYLATLQARIGAMARTHDLLSQSNWRPVEFSELCAQLWTLMGDGQAQSHRIRIHGPAVRIPPTTAGSFALALQELFTNAYKHGALRDHAGSVDLSWSVADSKLTLTWAEDCGRPVEPSHSHGAGMQLLEGLIQYDLRGTIKVIFEPMGLRCVVTVPLQEA
jgi:PAS domain S-box-containing protein